MMIHGRVPFGPSKTEIPPEMKPGMPKDNINVNVDWEENMDKIPISTVCNECFSSHIRDPASRLLVFVGQLFAL